MFNFFKKNQSEDLHKKSFKFLINTVFWQNKINKVLDIFYQHHYLDKTKLKDLPFEKLNKKGKWENLHEFILDFIGCLPFTENIDPKDKTMVINFFKYMLYQLAYKAYLKSTPLSFIQNPPYREDNLVELNRHKRNFYYDFLDEFKHRKDNYNLVLIQLLKIIL
ncbi:hypothetical protein [Mycoplasmopsis gallopavonis]|uniref:Uncharacterized protein n=1 Tax=Mycoplasmopsis gallopavonis TaxID=76629 RepID=A0A449AZV9_9BACT|nr:hypothetical protein [Mycoplasmopsis gallopavonis]RIV16905.1 hypothetical protein D1113_00545 [Mycoplasmopsis gallopavonis]VEU73015.1 Uncharacterised protein [Mycoplasmopsis gallopavonis]